MSTYEDPVSDYNPFVKYKVLYSEKYGRYLVARKKIDAGEVIIREMPTVIGPKVLDNHHLCFECMKLIPTQATIGNSSISCSNCQVAVFCSFLCRAQKSKHTIEECEILKNKNISFNVKDILLVLRVWLIKKKDERLWEKILRLQAHLEAQKDSPLWEFNEVVIVASLKSLGIVDKSEEKDFSELIQRICGILEVNSHAIPFEESSDRFVLRALYLEASLMTHDCRGNTFVNIDKKFELTIHASKPIDEGEMIFFNYTNPILSTVERQRWLRESMYFECDCLLCQDPYELGTNLSTMFCPYCNDGLITFASETTKNPYVRDKNWKCNKCQMSFSGHVITFYMYLVKIRIGLVKCSIKGLEVLLIKLSSIFHPNHSLMMSIKTHLLAVYKLENGYRNCQKKICNRVIEIGTDILNIFEIVEPGISFSKGVLLYDIFTTIFRLADDDKRNGKITREEFGRQLKRAMEYLKKSVEMLWFANPILREGILAEKASQEYVILLRQIKTFNDF